MDISKKISKTFGKWVCCKTACKQLILNDYENNLPVDNRKDPRLEKLKKWRAILWDI